MSVSLSVYVSPCIDYYTPCQDYKEDGYEEEEDPPEEVPLTLTNVEDFLKFFPELTDYQVYFLIVEFNYHCC